ncbi:MAG: DUF1254 domain-containing protein [Deltaproteobacteria bacterium]|nr:DUF1254 domain-containing protein [Deltaproteobacteria bacterium]
MKKVVKWAVICLLLIVLGGGMFVYKEAGGFSPKKLRLFYLNLTQDPWREQYAYALGKGVFPYVFPYFYSAQLRWMWTNTPRDPKNIPYAPINHFWHADHLADHKYRDGGTPNNDVIYSVAWVNVGKEPIILSHPDMGVRYFSFHFTKFSSDILDVVSNRATGGAAGHFALVHKDFNGRLPEGVTVLETAQTPWFLLLVRTMVNGSEDLPYVQALQKQYRLTPLSYWDKPEATLPVSRETWRPYRAKEDPLAHWKTINRAMTENIPPEYERALLNLLATVNIGPGQDVDALDEDSKQGLARAAREGMKMMVMARASLPGGDIINGWRRNPAVAGRMGEAGIYLTRGVVQSFKGISASVREEARYFATYKDCEGNALRGDKASYQLTFKAGEEPPVDAFWSLTMYGIDANLVANPINRYSIGDRTPGFKRNDDGSLTIYIQHESPGKDKESNWLPAPNDRFTMTFRAYGPRAEINNGQWVMPELETVN